MDVDKTVIAWLRGNLFLVIPFTILGLRLIIRWVTREEAKEIFRSLLSLPQDLMFISMGLLLSALARIAPGFARRYASDREADLAGACWLLALIVVTILLVYLGRVLTILWQKFYSALKQIRDRRSLDGTRQDTGNIQVAGRMFWLLAYWASLVLVLSIEVSVSVWCLWCVIYLIR